MRCPLYYSRRTENYLLLILKNNILVWVSRTFSTYVYYIDGVTFVDARNIKLWNVSKTMIEVPNTHARRHIQTLRNQAGAQLNI